MTSTDRRGRYVRTRPGPAPGTALHTWATTMTARGLAARTIGERTRIVAQAGQEIGVDVMAMTGEQILQWLAGLRRGDGSGVSPGTRATYWGALAAWHRWLVSTGRREADPMTVVQCPRVPRRFPRPLGDEAVARLEQTRMWGRTRVMVHLAALAGLRVHEIARVRGEDVDLWEQTLTVTGKGGVRETLPLHPRLVEDARTMPTRGWWFPAPGGDRPVRADTVSATLGRVIRRAGLTGSAHQLRHWFGTTLVRTGTDVRVVQTLMRHASLATTAGYVRVDHTQQRTAVDRLDLARAA